MPISWLDHKPHAIAVYASWPALPSAHATLATGRPATALPGPVLHRLDCTSFCWRLRKSRLVKLVRAQPGRLNWATTTGYSDFLFAAFLKNTGLAMSKVPYRDTVQASSDLGQGRIQMYWGGLAIVRLQVQAP
jgi:Tripartite tricarboxylate transporter family receptor